MDRVYNSKPIYRCNMDDYRGIEWPEKLARTPVVGEYIQAVGPSLLKLQSASLPTELEVCRIVHTLDCPEIHLHYGDTQSKQVLLTHGKLFNNLR